MSSYFADPRKQRRIAFVVLAAIILGLIVTAFAVFNHAKQTRAANDKADQLIAELHAQGLPAPARQQIARYLGEDGGIVCENPNDALRRAELNAQFTTGTGTTGQRPIVADSALGKGIRSVIKVYCPDQLAEFDANLGNLKFDDVIKGN